MKGLGEQSTRGNLESSTWARAGWFVVLALSTGCLTPEPSAQIPPAARASSAAAPATRPTPTVALGTAQASTATTPAVDRSAATLELVAIEPIAGTMLTRDSLIKARLRYTIERRPETRYVLAAQFKMADLDRTFDGSLPESAVTWIEESEGTVELVFPLHYVFDEARLARPAQVKFMLIQLLSKTRAIGIAQTGFIEYPLLAADALSARTPSP